MSDFGEKLLEKIRRAQPIVGAAVGSGFTAQAAERGEADFLMVLNAGFFRTLGCSSMAALMPYANANHLSWETTVRAILPRVTTTPVVLGVCAQDPETSLEQRIAGIKRYEIAGITNFPSVGFIDGQYREALEEAGLGFDREIEMLRAAKRAGLLTVGYCFNDGEALAMSRAGVDLLCLNLGFTEWRSRSESEHMAALDSAVIKINGILAQLRRERPATRVVIFGGPVVVPQDTTYVYQHTAINGYVGGSAIERFPASPLITQTMREFHEAAEAGKREGRLGAMIGRSEAMREVFELIRKVAATDAPVLITGESGTGKELAAREIHRLSNRATHPLVNCNCGAISETLAMSELFGHERGAFTGATSKRLGKFKQADEATLFLDELSDMPLSIQASLLRTLQENEVVPLGGDLPIPVDVRLIAATNQELPRLIHEGRFRLDLYYRLSTVILRIPPLRERKEDIPLLIRDLMRLCSEQYGCPVPAVSDEVMQLFMDHPWPGNIRELKIVVERCFILGRGAALRTEWLQDMFEAAHTLAHGQATPRNVASLDQRRERLEEVLARHNGNKTATARELGVTRKTIYDWLKHKKQDVLT